MKYHNRISLVTIIFLSTVLIMSCAQQGENENTPPDLIPGIVASDAVLTKVTSGMTFNTAGSPLYLDGYLYFTNNNFEAPEVSRTFRLSPSGKIDTLISDNGVMTTLWPSLHGTIYACEMLGHRVVELNKDGEILRVVAGEYQGKRIDGPNDIVIDKKGGLYFSDSQFIAGREKMQETPAVYYVKPDGAIIRVIDDIEFPNGMALSPDGATMYIANTPGEFLVAYDVSPDGTLENRRNFAAVELVHAGEPGGADGMAVDLEGNIYVATTRGLGIQVFNHKGVHLGNITVPTPANNVSFGGDDHKTLYISAQDGIYSIPVEVEGYVIDRTVTN